MSAPNPLLCGCGPPPGPVPVEAPAELRRMVPEPVERDQPEEPREQPGTPLRLKRIALGLIRTVVVRPQIPAEGKGGSRCGRVDERRTMIENGGSGRLNWISKRHWKDLLYAGIGLGERPISLAWGVPGLLCKMDANDTWRLVPIDNLHNWL